MKIVRWTEVVMKAGAPKIHLLLVEAKKDAVFQKALKSQRVMTLHQPAAGNRTDFGEVGYHESKNSQLVIFPKSLKVFQEKRVVGIKYDFLGEEIMEQPKLKKVTKKAGTSHPPQRPALSLDNKEEAPSKASERKRPQTVDFIKKEIYQAISDLENGNEADALKRLQQIVED